ncbi:MAG: hypothetical protein K1Y02_08635 [Candidatus Hydrogenedentes bacterium]|nr:hypothetical protein [Candidatus Hydrogenedentota bacterium]
MRFFSSLAVPEARALVFGVCPNPVRVTPHITVGSGETIPEVNYILPHGSEVSASTIDDVVTLYARMAEGVLERAYDLGIAKLIIEIELVFELTLNPSWGARVIRVTREAMDRYEAKGVHSALRTTVADIRDRVRPPRLRTSDETRLVFECFEACAADSDILSIESTGGKEVSDDALLNCDIGGVLFAMGTLGSNDMEFLWTKICKIADTYGKVAGGDAACGFANTAMQLARKRMLPTVFAAMVRAVGAARSLVAIECGAKGPDKDCAYEGPVLKAIAGIPIAMEGKSAACAHSSPVGNVAMACCDTWSNESVPFVQLFGGFSPEVSLEQLWYDCKLMNEATRSGDAVRVRDLLTLSDVRTSAEALVLAPESCMRIAKAIISTPDRLQRAHRAAKEALAIIDEAAGEGRLSIPEVEQNWIGMIRAGMDEFESLGDGAAAHYAKQYAHLFVPSEYGLT